MGFLCKELLTGVQHGTILAQSSGISAVDLCSSASRASQT